MLVIQESVPKLDTESHKESVPKLDTESHRESVTMNPIRNRLQVGYRIPQKMVLKLETDPKKKVSIRNFSFLFYYRKTGNSSDLNTRIPMFQSFITSKLET
ncbi:unnamed protein product [Rhizophagus irregularis]|nr:unnamed protein product [Rhizophagus irregularis]